MADSGWVLPDKYDKDLKDENGNPLSKSEFKKRQKAAEKAKKAAEKAAAKAAKPQPTKKKQVGPPRQMCAWTGSIPRPKIQTSRPPFARLVAFTPLGEEVAPVQADVSPLLVLSFDLPPPDSDADAPRSVPVFPLFGQ